MKRRVAGVVGWLGSSVWMIRYSLPTPSAPLIVSWKASGSFQRDTAIFTTRPCSSSVRRA